MCGRFTLTQPAETVADLFPELGPLDPSSLQPRYNIAPTQSVVAVRVPNNKANAELVMLRWGLVPSWSKDLGVGARMINARSETVATKPSFRSPFRRQRCLVPADGFYEWQRTGGRKQPVFIHLRQQQPFAFAGLWDRWRGTDGVVFESCTVLTTGPNDLLRAIHDRMPVILPRRHYGLWLDPNVTEPEAIESLLRPYPADQMATVPVTTHVNSPRNDNPRCLEPVQ